MRSTKYLFIIAFFGFLSTSQAHASDIMTCQVPNNCEVIGSHYNAGKGSEVINYTEVTCKDKQTNKISQYIHSKVSFSGILGINRIFIPKQINFVNANVTEMICK